MPRIKIEDLPVLEDLSTKKMKGIFGGLSYTSSIDSTDDGKDLRLIDPMASEDRLLRKIAPDDFTGIDEKDVKER